MTATNVHADSTRSGLVGRRAQAGHPKPPAREHVGAAALLGLFLLIYLWPALIQGHLLSDVSFLYLLPPWDIHAPADLAHYMNPLLSDVAQYQYPWDVYVRHAIHSGVFPSWSPYVLSGTPFYTNSQNGLTALFNLPLWVLPLNYALGLVGWLKLWVAATGAYLLARQLRLSFWPGVLAGVCFGLCAFNIDWLEHQTLPASAVWLPWAVLAVERLLHRRRASDVAWLALASALVIDGGHPGTEVQTLGAAAFYALLRVGTMEGVTGSERVRGVGLTAAGMVLGAALMAFVILPVTMAASGTQGAATRAGGGYSMPTSALRTIFFPGWWGRPSEGNYAGPINYVERTMYGGVIGLLMAGLALTLRAGWRRKLPLLVIGIVGPAVAVGVPVVHGIVVHLPFFSSVQEARMLFWGPFAVALLAAFGLQGIIDRPPELWRGAWLVVGAAVLVALIAVVGLSPSLHEIRTTINHFRTGTSYIDPDVLALTSIGWWLIFTVAVAAALLIWRKGWLAPRTVAMLLVLAAAADMFHFAHGFLPMGPVPRAVPGPTPAIAYLQRNTGQSRVVGLTDGPAYSVLLADTNINYGLREPTGQDPPQPTLRYFHLWQLANPDQNEVFGLNVPTITPVGLHVMNVLGVRYILTAPGAPAVAGLPVVYRGADLTIYENSAAVAPAFVPPAIEAVTTEESALAAISSPGFDPQRVALVEPEPSSGVTTPAGAGTVTIDRERGSSVSMSANMSRGGLVVLNDAWAKGWTVDVDGHPAQMLRVNDVMRGVDVPAGSHSITWHYEVPGLKLGAVVSGIALLLLLLLGAWPALRRRRAAAPG